MTALRANVTKVMEEDHAVSYKRFTSKDLLLEKGWGFNYKRLYG